MARQSIDEFLRSNAQKEGSAESFVLETSEILEVNVDGLVWAKVGSMVAYNGDVHFERQSTMEGGMKKLLKKQLSGEGAVLMKMEGRGRVYLADRKKKIAIFDLAGESMSVNGNDLLAMESGIDWDIEMTGGAGMTSGGLFNMKLSGQGMVAITTKGSPLTLSVEAGEPVYTDPQATVAWSGSLTPTLKTDISWKELIGRSSGEAVQLCFDGQGWVMVQPAEEGAAQQPG